MVPYDVKLSYAGKSWMTVRLELGHDEIGDTHEPDLVVAEDLLELFARLGLPQPRPVPVLRADHQIAQKLHTCTAVGSDRAHDIVDLQLLAVGTLDYVLAAAQGVVNFLALFRAQSAGTHAGVAEILGESFLFGPIGGVAGLFLFAAIYGRLGKRAGGKTTRTQVIHVLAYGGMPVVASLGIWVLTALLAGENTFIETPRSDTEVFVVLLLRVQFFAYVLLLLWSIVLQVMGFSEIQGIATRKAFWMWVLGQIVGLLAAIFLSVIIATLLPGVVPH